MSIGIAMLARNSANDLPRALCPFVGKVDEIAVLLGGKSSDGTAFVASEYTGLMADYTGPLDEEGGLLDFGLARQQSFDLLSTDWALVVDTDDVWSGVEKLGEVVQDAEGRQGVLFPHVLSASHPGGGGPGATFMQPRLYWRDSGHWSSPVHELFIYNEPEVKTLQVNAMGIRQEKDPEGRMASTWRNIKIAEAHLGDHLDFRLLLHLANEYLITAQYDKALAVTYRYLSNLDLATSDDTRPDKMFQIHYLRGMAHLCLEEWEQVASAAMAALGFAKCGHGWALLAEAAFWLDTYDLTIWAADKALAMGRPSSTIPISFASVSSVPYHLKAKALAALGRKREALTALELGLALGGGKDMTNLKYELCEELGVIP